MISIEEIPFDLEEMIEAREHACGTYSDKFDKLMLENELFEYGSTRRSHRIITEKCENIGYWGVISLLTGMTKDDVNDYYLQKSIKRRIDEMYETAQEFGYTISKDCMFGYGE